MKWIIIMFFFLSSCRYFMETLRIDHEKVREVTILNRKNSLSIILTDPVLIKDLLQDCLNGAIKQPVKFYWDYKLDIKEIDTSYAIYIGGNSVRRGVVTYKSGCDVESSIRALFR